MDHDIDEMTERQASGQKGGQASRSHGVYALEDRGEDALDTEQKGTFLEIEQGLETPEGIVIAMRRRVAMSLMVVGVLETYLEEQINGGVSPDGIPIFKSWPAFQNTAVRALSTLLSNMPKPQHDALSDEVLKIRKLIEHAEDAPESHGDAPGANGAAQESERD